MQTFSTDSEKWFFGSVDPLLGGEGTLAEDVTEGFDDLIAVELVGIPFLDPREAGVRLIGGVERLQLALGVEVSLHVGNVRVVAAVALQLIQDLQEHPEDEIASCPAPVGGLVVDVEEDDIGVGNDRALNVSP